MRYLLKISLAFFLLSSCDSRKEASQILVDSGFSNYINAFTSGVISSQSNIRIILRQPNEKANPGEPVSDDLFDFEPSIEGQAFWLDDQTIEFRPDEKLTSGQQYIGTFDLGELIDVPSNFKEMEFGFAVITQSLFVNVEGLHAPDIADLTIQELVGSIRTSDKTSTKLLEKCLSAEQNGKTLQIKWEHKDKKKTHRFTIFGIERGNDESFVNITWNGESIGSKSDDDKEVRVPPLGEFTLLQVNTLREPSLHFSILLSDPVASNQDLTGLVYLKSGKKLRLSIIGNEIKAYPIGKLNSKEIVIVTNHIENTAGNKLQDSYERKVEFNITNPAIELLGEGVIMPTGGNINFPFKAVNIKAVNLRVVRIFEHNVHQFLQNNQLDGHDELTRVGRLIYDGSIDLFSEEPIDYGVWNNFTIDLSNMIDPEPGAIYRVLMSFERNQSLYPCGDANGEIKPMKKHYPNQENGSGWYSDWNWYEGYGNYSERENPCSESYYNYNEKSISTNLIASNIGMIAKETTDNGYDVVITDLRSAEAMSGITVEAWNYQQQKIGEGETNGDGIVRIKTDGKPYLIVASQGKQRGYLRVDNGSALSVSLYEVGGKKIKKGIKGYLYGERGVWRPGDTVHLSFILEDKLNSLPQSHPVVIELFDPKGKLYDKKVSTKGVNGMYYFKLFTRAEDLTGLWRAKATVGNSTFYKSLKIESIKPNRIKINFDFADVISSSSPIQSTLTATWLYGSPGTGLKTRVETELENMKTKFKGYDNYQFDDRTKRFWGNDISIEERKTDGNGKADFQFKIKKPNEAPGMLKLKFRTKVFEQGGDFSQDFISKKYSPYTSYVGIKLDRGKNWLTALNTKEETPIAIATVNEKGQPTNRKVHVELFKLSWNWWWEGNGTNELTHYIRSHSKTRISEQWFEVTNGKGIFDLSFDKPSWGRFLLKVTDTKSGHSTAQIVYADYPGWFDNDGSGAEAATMLSIETKKKKHEVGEDIEITVPSGGIGNIYVTVEKGDKILDQFWVEAAPGSTQFAIEATKEMAPNVYVSATLIQPHAQEENSLPIRMYGVIPVFVNDAETHVNPVISSVNEVHPETSFQVKVKEQDGKKMAYSLAVVDEGLLSLTRFKTPDAWSTFYSKEALAVRTWDLYKYVMSAKTGKMTPLLAVGGDEALVYKDDEKANRFKPVVSYLGPFYLDDGDENEHKIDIPNYIGAVRIMVVAGYKGAYGSAEKEVQVKQPLMVLSTLPRVLGPSETITVPVNVITMKDNIKNVKVKVSSNDMLQLTGQNEQQITFSKSGEKTVYFEFKVAQKLGIAKYKVEVNSGTETAFEEIELDVRAPNPVITNNITTAVAAGETWTSNYTALGITGSNKASISISKIPDLNLEKHLKYLMQYPYGCIEQTTSSAFPQLFLKSLMELSNEEEEKIDDNIMAALNRLRLFQMSDGGFAYWPSSSSYISEWGTNYAGHFMIEAKNKSFDLPPGILEQWQKFQRNRASNWNRKNYNEYGRYGGDLTQAYRLYTLALNGSPDVGAMNRLKNDRLLSNAAAWRLAAAYAIIGREDAAKELTKERSTKIEPYRDMGYSYGSNTRDLAMLIETMAYLKDFDRGAILIKELALQLKDGWHSTQTRAYGMLAIAKFIGDSKPGGEYSFDLNINGNADNIDSDLPIRKQDLEKKDLKEGTISFKNTSKQVLFINFNQSGIPVEMSQAATQKDLNMNVEYFTMENVKLDVSALKQGQDFKAKIRITHPGYRSNYKEIALNQIFPSGWQIINTRVSEESFNENQFNYQDIKDDRVYTYFDLKQNSSKTIEVLLNATFAGKFYKPGIVCAPMYDETVIAIEPGGWVVVE